jgi:soluble lytic murein transglycosylase
MPLDIGQPRIAYRVARDAPTPAKDNYRVDRDFTAGWIALRFLHDPATAMRHFANIATFTRNPTALARAGYWQGRAAEALDRPGEAKTFYAAAGRFPTTYYGQLARARLGDSEIALRSPPLPSAARRAALARSEIVRALALVYAAGARDLAIPIVADIAGRSDNVGELVMMAEIAQHNRDARAMLLIGKAALSHGYAFAQYAFPTIGIPAYRPIGPQIDASVLYSIVRQESAFNQKTVSSANAYGLMQVTPDAGRYIAHKFGVHYDRKRLLDDSVYNVQMGAAELGDLIRDYRGSYILTFAGYNAGRGRVRDWIARYGDPRNPNIDPVDWVEMIPFSETRNYVQRILENMQVYRARFGNGRRLMIEADLHRGTAEN